MNISKEVKRSLILFIVAIAGALFMRFLGEFGVQRSAAEYVALPYLITLLIIVFVRPYDPDLRHRYRLIFRDSMLAFFGIAIVFFEGFICVLFFIPIYMMMIGVALATEALLRSFKHKKENKIVSHVLPLLVLVASLEGVTPSLSVDRTNIVSVNASSTLSIQELQANLLSEISLPVNRHWLLSVFPIPYEIEADSFQQGAIHTARFNYKRWFFTNEHEGFIKLRIETIDEEKITIRFLEDSSYLSTYLSFEKSEFRFTENPDGTTNIQLAITFERELDPFWYFEPLERYTMTQAANYIINNMALNNGTE
jgi:uncharacterized membrane protein YoaK (UPF0700 family)